MAVFLDAFLTPFVTCFKNHFELTKSEYSLVELFLYFICISYPEDKCNQVLHALYKEGSLTKEMYQTFKVNLIARKGKSKKDIATFIKLNPCFQIYCSKVLKGMDSSTFDEQAKLMVHDFLFTESQ
jgi:hypothetical protein